MCFKSSSWVCQISFVRLEKLISHATAVAIEVDGAQICWHQDQPLPITHSLEDCVLSPLSSQLFPNSPLPPHSSFFLKQPALSRKVAGEGHTQWSPGAVSPPLLLCTPKRPRHTQTHSTRGPHLFRPISEFFLSLPRYESLCGLRPARRYRTCNSQLDQMAYLLLGSTFQRTDANFLFWKLKRRTWDEEQICKGGYDGQFPSDFEESLWRCMLVAWETLWAPRNCHC